MTARRVLDVLLLQVGWFACVGGASIGQYWLGPALVVILLGAHLRFSDHPRLDLLLICLLGGVGTVLDSLQSALGLLSFRGAPLEWLCPPWITALWLHFAIGLRGPLSGFAARPLWAILFGVVGGPMAYWAGVRLGAAGFHENVWWSVASIALVWGTVFPLALRFAHSDTASTVKT